MGNFYLYVESEVNIKGGTARNLRKENLFHCPNLLMQIFRSKEVMNMADSTQEWPLSHKPRIFCSESNKDLQLYRKGIGTVWIKLAKVFITPRE